MRLAILFVALAAFGLTACAAATTVVGTAASVTGSAVSTAADVTGDVVGAAADAVSGDHDKSR